MEGPGTLEEEALKRKEKLKNLKRKASVEEIAEESSSKDDSVPLPKPKFSSYKPLDENLQKEKPVAAVPTLVEEEAKDSVEAGKEKVVLQHIAISSLAPKKPEKILKRVKKVDKLERRTQRAIAELIWERLRHGNDENLNSMVTMNADRPADED